LPPVQLHADYDQDGRLQGSAREYALRAVAPGAILVANLDADGRRLPAGAQPGGRIVLDRDQPVALAGDDEQLPLRIVAAGPLPAGSTLVLRPVGLPPDRIRIADSRGRPLPAARSGKRDFALPVLPPAGLDLKLSATVQPGSPRGRTITLNPRYRPDGQEESAFRLLLVRLDGAGVETVEDEARFSVAPFIILDNAARALRAYIVELTENQPSLIEFEAACRALGVPVVRVPEAVANGDAWLQDQFQHALVQGADGWRQLIVHLPRRRSNGGQVAGPNLASFVASHFASRNIGLFDDLWRRRLELTDSAGRTRQVSFEDCDAIGTLMIEVQELAGSLVRELRRLDPRYPFVWIDSWTLLRATLPRLVGDLRRRIDLARRGTDPIWSAILDRRAVAARQLLERIEEVIPHAPGRDTTDFPAGGADLSLAPEAADNMFPRLVQLHHSSNFGGNIEASPPMPGASLGKLVIGNVLAGGRDFMDPDLLRLLHKQRKQPLVQVDTTWLQVGHVDEILAFAPDRRAGAGAFALLRAAPDVAFQLLDGARARYMSGLSPSHPHRGAEIMGVRRNTIEGAAPVTRMFRGKVWSHVHPPRGSSGPSDIVEPPDIYRQVVHGARSAVEGGLHYVAGEGEDRTYPADLTVREALFGERDAHGESCNQFIARERMAPVVRTLIEAFPRVRIFPLPVLFDRVASTSDWLRSPDRYATRAFMPDLVNFQLIEGRLLVPRPYGPRMRPVDAIAVIGAVLREIGASRLARRLTPRFIRDRGLLRGIYWLHREPRVYVEGIGRVYDGLDTEDRVFDQFRDSFPEATNEQARRGIIEPNRRHFDAFGELRPGWRRFVIAETMIDLFETWTEMIAAEIDVRIDWIDSWYYHVRSGGIHCGTNVLRMPAPGAALPPVWAVPDTVSPTAPAARSEAPLSQGAGT